MRAPNRRSLLAIIAGFIVSGRAVAAPDSAHALFVNVAFEMKKRAVESGDQAFGAVVVRNGDVIGFGPSRVIVNNDATAHAEREAIRDAQVKLDRTDLSDCVIYSTSRPCRDCERAAAQARIARMYVGAEAADAGPPRAR